MKKNAPRKKTEAEKEEIPKDLQDMLGSLTALATIHTLLQRGMFQVTEHGAVASSIQYVEILHKQVMSDAKAHPKAHLSPQLVAANRTPEEQEKLDKEFLEIVEKTQASDKTTEAQAVQ